MKPMNKTDVKEIFSANLRRILHEREITLSELARRTGKSVVSLSEFAAGRHEPPLSTAVTIAEALDADLVRLATIPAKGPVPHFRRGRKKSRQTA